MNSSSLARLRLRVTVVVSLAIWLLRLWQHSHSGVPSHRFLALDEMPSISNWWGAAVLPVLTWFLTGRVAKRLAAFSAYATMARTAWFKVQTGYVVSLR